MNLQEIERESSKKEVDDFRGQGIPRKFEPEIKSDEQTKNEKIMEGLGVWVSYWRANPHRFVKEYLKLTPFSWFQAILLFMMFKVDHFMWFASRGQ